MGDIRRARKHYQGPSHPWQRARIEEEKPLMKEYALKNKTELWKMHSKARTIALQAKKLLATKEKQAEKEKELLMKKLLRYNLIMAGQPIDAALSLSYKDLLERRLQTIVFRRSLAKSMGQARQFITHGHIKVGEKAITSPSYIVSVEEEGKIQYSEISPIASEAHPERAKASAPKEEKKEEVKESKKEEKKHEAKKEHKESKKEAKADK